MWTGCKVTSCQSWRFEKILLVSPPWAIRVRLGQGSAAEFFSKFQLWQLVTLQPVDLQTPTVPLWKDLTSSVDSNSVQETILKIGFALSKWPHFHREFSKRPGMVVRHCIPFGIMKIILFWQYTVLDYDMKICNGFHQKASFNHPEPIRFTQGRWSKGKVLFGQ